MQRVPADADGAAGAAGQGGAFGVIPHQVRGFLTQYAQKLIVGRSFPQCTGCSPAVVRAYVVVRVVYAHP